MSGAIIARSKPTYIAQEEKMVTKDITIGELLSIDMGVAPVLMSAGMHCVGCYASQMETIEEAAMVHGIDPDELLEQVNAYLDGENGRGHSLIF